MPRCRNSCPMTGPTSSCPTTWKLPTPLASSADRTASAPSSRLVPTSGPVCGRRTIIWFASAAPYCCTIFSPSTGASASRILSSVTGSSNSMTIRLPPEKSMPSGSPPRANSTAAPATMITSDTSRACERQAMKSKSGCFLKSCTRAGSLSAASRVRC